MSSYSYRPESGWRVFDRFMAIVCAVLLGAFFGGFGHAVSVARVQDASVAATQSEMYAAIRKITFNSENTTGIGPIDSSKPLMTVYIRNDSDYPLTLKEFSVQFAVSGEITAWPVLNGEPSMYRMQFNVPRGERRMLRFPSTLYQPIEPHTTATLDLFASIPDAPKLGIAAATTFVDVEFFLGPWHASQTPDIMCRSWRVE